MEPNRDFKKLEDFLAIEYRLLEFAKERVKILRENSVDASRAYAEVAMRLTRIEAISELYVYLRERK